MAFQLGAARTLLVPYPLAPPLFGSFAPELVWPAKSSAGILPFGLDLTEWIETINGGPSSATIAIVPSSDPNDLAASVTALFGNIVAFTAASGLPGTIYEVELNVVASDGTQETFEALLPINFFSPATAPPIALLPPGIPPMAVSLNNTAGSLASPFVITAQFTGFSVVTAPNNYCILPANPGVPVVVINQAVNGSPLIVLPPNNNTSINGLPNGSNIQIPAPTVTGAVQQSTFIYGTIAPSPTQIEAY